VSLHQMVLIGFLACMVTGVLFIGAQLLWYLLLRLHVSRYRVRVVQVHGDVVVNTTVQPLRRPED